MAPSSTVGFPALPGFWEWMFVYYEPLATFSPVFMYFISPGKLALYDMPGLEDLPVSKSLPDSRAEMALFQMINCHFLVVLFVSFVFQAAKKGLNHDLRAQEQIGGAVLTALAVVDITHVMGITFCVIPEAIRYTPSAWGTTTYVSHTMVLFDFFMRLAWFAGVGRTRYYYGQPDTKKKVIILH